MKKFLLFIITILLCVVGHSQSLSFDKKLHNFGTINEVDGSVTHTFIAKNISDKPFIINYISTGCGCTAAQYDKSPIMPNKTREILVEFDPENRAGLFNTVINIVGGTKIENHTLRVIGNIAAQNRTIEELYPIIMGDIRVKEDFIPFGIIPNREIHTQFIELYNNSDKLVKLDVKNSGTENTKVWLTRDEVAPSRKSYLMYEINLKDSDLLGDINDVVTLTVNGVEQKNKIKVSATAIPNVYDYTVEQLDNSPIATIYKTEHTIENIDKKNCSYSFKIENNAKGELKILKAIKKHKTVDYTINFTSLKAGQKGEITLTLNPDKFENKANGTVTFITSSPQTPIFSLTLTGKKTN